MISIFLFTLLALPSIYVLQSCWCLRRNIATTKATGLTYVVLPWNSLNLPWLIIRPILLPIFQYLPIRDALWFRLLSVDWPWHDQYSIFQELGCDNFITVSPARNNLYTADAAVIDQITKRRNDFPKPIELYRSLDLYGKNVVSTEGNVWRLHRKTVSPPFNEKNNQLVWLESLRQVQAMVDGWLGSQTKSSSTVHTLAEDCMKLSLHVISYAGFGVKLDWPDQGQEGGVNGSTSSTAVEASRDSRFGSDHTMTYTEALQTLLHNIVWILVLPIYLLSKYPPVSKGSPF